MSWPTPERLAIAAAQVTAAYFGEFRRLLAEADARQAAAQVTGPARTEINCTQASTQQAWQGHQPRPVPARAQAGFRQP